jgi:hypothetical protein
MQDMEIKRISVPSQCGPKKKKSSMEKKLGIVVCTCQLSYGGKLKIRVS